MSISRTGATYRRDRMKLRKIISGGQTGADQAALYAASYLGLETGGTMPKRFRTETGDRPDLARLFDMKEHTSWEYPPRTEQNIIDSDGTLIFGKSTSSGSRLTIKLCKKHNKPYVYYDWTRGKEIDADVKAALVSWLEMKNINVLNVAGNRESSNPGIFKACKEFLIESLKNASKK